MRETSNMRFTGLTGRVEVRLFRLGIFSRNNDKNITGAAWGTRSFCSFRLIWIEPFRPLWSSTGFRKSYSHSSAPKTHVNYRVDHVGHANHNRIFQECSSKRSDDSWHFLTMNSSLVSIALSLDTAVFSIFQTTSYPCSCERCIRIIMMGSDGKYSPYFMD